MVTSEIVSMQQKSYIMIQYHLLCTGYLPRSSYLTRLIKDSNILYKHCGFYNSLWLLVSFYFFLMFSPPKTYVPSKFSRGHFLSAIQMRRARISRKFTGNPNIAHLIQKRVTILWGYLAAKESLCQGLILQSSQQHLIVSCREINPCKRNKGCINLHSSTQLPCSQDLAFLFPEIFISLTNFWVIFLLAINIP